MNMNPYPRLQRVNIKSFWVAWLCYFNAVLSLYLYFRPSGSKWDFFNFCTAIGLWLWNLLSWEKNKIWMHNQRVILRQYRRDILRRVVLLRSRGIEPPKQRFKFPRMSSVTRPAKK